MDFQETLMKRLKDYRTKVSSFRQTEECVQCIQRPEYKHHWASLLNCLGHVRTCVWDECFCDDTDAVANKVCRVVLQRVCVYVRGSVFDLNHDIFSISTATIHHLAMAAQPRCGLLHRQSSWIINRGEKASRLWPAEAISPRQRPLAPQPCVPPSITTSITSIFSTPIPQTPCLCMMPVSYVSATSFLLLSPGLMTHSALRVMTCIQGPATFPTLLPLSKQRRISHTHDTSSCCFSYLGIIRKIKRESREKARMSV